MQNNKGFTIIELMIAVAIIGVLAAIAVPAYGNYLNRAKLSEGVNMMAPFKVALAECAENHGGDPKDTSCAPGKPGMPGSQTGKYAKIELGNTAGTIEMSSDSGDLFKAFGAYKVTLTAVSKGAGQPVGWACTVVNGTGDNIKPVSEALPASLNCSEEAAE